MKKIILFCIMISSLFGEDSFLGVEMLSKVDKSQWTCEICEWDTDFLECKPTKLNKTKATSITATKDYKVVQIWLSPTGDYKSDKYMDDYLAWVQPVYDAVSVKYGKPTCKKVMTIEYCKVTHNETEVTIVSGRKPGIHYTHNLHKEIKMSAKKRKSNITVPDNI